MFKPVLIADGKKRCSICGRSKRLDCFPKNKYAKSGLRSQCKKCRNKLARTYYEKPDKKQVRATKQLKQKYGISLEQYDRMFEKQNGICVICGGTNINGRRLAVDHDHDTGKIRGLLCVNCNLALGYAKDDIGLLAKMINYLQSY